MKRPFKVKTLGLLVLSLMLSLCILGQDESTKAEIFDYDLGDVFHLYKYGKEGSQLMLEEHLNICIIDKYYSQNFDTLFYLEEVSGSFWEFGGPTIYFNRNDTLRYIDLDSLIFNGNADSVYSDSTLYNGRINLFVCRNKS